MKNNQNSALRKLFLEQLQDIYDAETQLVDALPLMASATTSSELRNAFEEHLDVTYVHIERLEQIFELLGESAEGKTCQAMEGLLDEGEEIMDGTEEDTMVRDCGLIIAAQKIEHYEIASYGAMRSLAEILELEDVSELLQATLDEEKDADERLTELAVGYINEEAEDEE